MPYHSGLTRVQGDPGFFGFLGKLGGTILRAAPGPIGTIAKTIGLPSFGGTKAPSVATPGFAQPRPPTTIPQQLPPAVGPCPPGEGGPKGYHLNKSGYFLKDGTYVAPGTKWVRNRRRNPLNIRALRKANSRQRGFLRAVDSTLRTMPTKAGVAKRRKHTRSA